MKKHSLPATDESTRGARPKCKDSLTFRAGLRTSAVIFSGVSVYFPPQLRESVACAFWKLDCTHRTAMIKTTPFWGAMETRRRIAAAKSLILCLDFDGTLAPLQPTPGEVQLDLEVQRVLENLGSRGNARIAIVSGRELRDLQSRVGLRGIIYAAEHGMEIYGGGLRRTEPGALACRGVMQEMGRTLKEGAGGLPGVLIEEKQFTLAVHYRLARTEDLKKIEAEVRAATAAAGPLVELRHGKKVWEILPATGWRKGAAAAWIYQMLAEDDSMSRDLAVYAGDDEADEDAFRQLAGWITLRVGPNARTAAQFCLTGPDEMHQFLIWLMLNRDCG